MKEIKYYKNRPYLRYGIESLEVEETNLVFEGGFAIAEATMSGTDMQFQPFTYTCTGIITEGYHEAFDDIGQSRYLMFVPNNKQIVRCGKNDFIVKVACENGESTTYEYKHIRVIDGIPTLMNKDIGGCTKTEDGNIITSNGLYNPIKGEFLSSTHSYKSELKICKEYCNMLQKVLWMQLNERQDKASLGH